MYDAAGAPRAACARGRARARRTPVGARAEALIIHFGISKNHKKNHTKNKKIQQLILPVLQVFFLYILK